MDMSLLLWMTFCAFYFHKVESSRLSLDDCMHAVSPITEVYERMQSRELGKLTAEDYTQHRPLHQVSVGSQDHLSVPPAVVQLPFSLLVIPDQQGPVELTVASKDQEPITVDLQYPTLLVQNSGLTLSSNGAEFSMLRQGLVPSGRSEMAEGLVPSGRSEMAEGLVPSGRSEMAEGLVPSGRSEMAEEGQAPFDGSDVNEDEEVHFTVPELFEVDYGLPKHAETRPEMSDKPVSRKRRSVVTVESDPKDSTREGRQLQGSNGLYLREYIQSDTSESWNFDFGFKITFPKNISGYGIYNNPGNLTVSNNSGESFSKNSTRYVFYDGEGFSKTTFNNGIVILYKADTGNNARINVRDGRASVLYYA